MPRRRHPSAPFVGGTLTPLPDLPEAEIPRGGGRPFTEAEVTHSHRCAMIIVNERLSSDLADIS
jgi:hypothetical protein